VNVDGDEVSIRALAELVAQLVGYEGEVRWDTTKPDGVMRKRLDGAKLRRMLSMPLCRTPLATGLARTIEWYMDSKAEADARA
jgi:GDP-L-fucose synthase